jgi:hypothetical protein
LPSQEEMHGHNGSGYTYIIDAHSPPSAQSAH